MALKDKKIIKIANFELSEGSQMYSEKAVKEAVLELRNKFLPRDEENDVYLAWIDEIFGDFTNK